MKKLIKEINDYNANNPFIKKEPFKHWFMRKSFLLYKKLRIMISKWYPLSHWQKSMWMGEERMVSRQRETNAAINCIAVDDDKTVQPYFNIEFLSILELIPKEQINDVITGIEKLRKKHSSYNIFDRHCSDAGYLKNFNDGDAYSTLGALRIKDKSRLKKYINQINFQTVNLTDSFCCLNTIVFLNESLKKELSSFIISHVPDQNVITGYENKRWYQIRNLGKGTFSGDMHKYNTLEKVITDVKWNVMKEISKYISSMVFQSQSINTPCVSTVITNIDGNCNRNFWRSLNIKPQFCDFYNNMTACIAWRSHDNSPFFIYTIDKKNNEFDCKNDILSYHIGDELSSYLIASCVVVSVRNKLTKYSFDISKLKKKNTRHWLKSKVQANTETFYEARFMSEYKYPVQERGFDDFINLEYEKPMILYFYSNIENQIKNTKKLYEDINKLYQLNIDYRNVESNYRMQRTALIISSISVLVAIVAIIISVFSSESAINTIISCWNWLKQTVKSII